MLLLDDTSESAIAVDPRLPKSAHRLAAAMTDAWPRLSGRVEMVESTLDEVELSPGDVVVAAHACGSLTDQILTKAMRASARVAVLPCCHEKATGDQGGLEGWLDPSVAIDATRAARLRTAGYTVYTQTIPRAITEKNRLLLADPA
jgi:hypothetical protein